MRPVQPPRLKLRPARKGRNATWVIKDQEREISTGAREKRSTSSKIDNRPSGTVIPIKS
jgi:hypothetical protein